MDELTSSFQASLSSRAQDFKSKSSKYSQKDRISKALESQHSKRKSVVALLRQLSEANNKEENLVENNEKDEKMEETSNQENGTKGEIEDAEIEEEEGNENMEGVVKTVKEKGNYKHGKRKNQSKSENLVMFGELLEEPPNDAENWKAVFYPTGKRCLVVASKGRTRVYLSNGKLYKTISSLLPGGSHFSEGNNNKESCVLDCILNETEMIFHVIDMLCWRSHPFYDCETDFRFFWLNSKLLEVPVSQAGKFV